MGKWVGIKRIHKILKFSQALWLQSYIDLNTLYRSRAQNVFEANFYKLMNNAVYGETMKNFEKRRDVRVVTNWDDNTNSTKRRYGAKHFTA